MSSKEDPNEDLCGVCDKGGDLICCDSCPLAFHAGCIGYQDWDFLKEDEPWYCWACSQRKRKPFARDDRAIKMPMQGSAVFVATDGTCREYAMYLFDEGVSENMMRITGVSTGEQEEIRLSSQRIWKGSTAQGIFIESGDSFFPTFHRIAIDLSRKDEIKKFLEGRKRKSSSAIKAPKEAGHTEAIGKKKIRGESTRITQSGKSIASTSLENREQNDTHIGKGQGAPSGAHEMPEDTEQRKDGRKSVIRAPPSPSEQGKAHKRLEDKETRKSPMSDDGAAAVLSGLANVESAKEATVPTSHKCVNLIKSWRALQVTDAARVLTVGDRVEIWVDATRNSPGGWVGGTVCDLCILNLGASAPHFAFILARFDSLRLAFDGKCYLEWRPLAVKVPSSDAPAYQIQVRIPSSQPRGASFTKGDRAEALIDDVWCPGTITSIGEHLCHIIFDCPALDKDHVRGDHCLTFVRRPHGLEDYFYGMLKEFSADS